MARSPRRMCRALALMATLFVTSSAGLNGQSVPPLQGGQFRVASWNIRFFPEPSTDVDRTAEILADLDADLIAVQEITDADALAALLNQVNAHLTERALASDLTPPRYYGFVLAESGGHGGLFVGYVYDQNAVRLSGVETLTSLQMTPDLRPALLARVTSLRGGLDFQVIVTHTDSGTKIRDYTHRMEFLDSLAVELERRWEDEADFIVLGDLNTMGHAEEEHDRRVSGEEEIAILDRKAWTMGLRRLPSSPSCTEYYLGRGSLLDHIMVTLAMREVLPNPVARVFGYCAAVGCQPVDTDNMPYDYAHVSDHCPVVIDLADVDWD